MRKGFYLWMTGSVLLGLGLSMKFGQHWSLITPAMGLMVAGFVSAVEATTKRG